MKNLKVCIFLFDMPPAMDMLTYNALQCVWHGPTFPSCEWWLHDLSDFPF